MMYDPVLSTDGRKQAFLPYADPRRVTQYLLKQASRGNVFLKGI